MNLISSRTQGGMSFIEITMTIGVLSVLSSLALPSVVGLMNSAAVRSERLVLIQDIRVTRFKAISYRRPAYLCALNAQGLCSRQAHWNTGWMGFVDNNLNGLYDDGDEQVVRHQAPRQAQKVDIIFHARWKDIKFDSRGILRRSGHFRLCNPDRKEKHNMKVIRMNTFGRLAIETDELACE